MFTEIRTAFRPAIGLLLLLTLITGLLYPLLVLGIAQSIFPNQANGSLVRDGDLIRGSELIGQTFTRPGYIHGRPSAAGKGYDASASSGSNLGPTSKALADTLRDRIAAVRREDGVRGPIPADLVTASGSGLDPHISPAAALAQVPRIAAARDMPARTVRDLVERAIEIPTFGVLGDPHVNVLRLNRQLDAIGAHTAR